MNSINITEVIDKKKNGKALSTEEIYFFIEGVTNDEIPDYQASALLMAICINGMTERETYDLTMAMRYSGHNISFEDFGHTVVDKHSTGGIGDKTTLIIGPIMAAAGVRVAKMSGRGLGITGGTIDKLESIPGFSSFMTEEQLVEQVKTVGFADAAQTENLAPADKKLYALRDVTATVDSIPLIASSIMCKKLSSGADGIVLDVKYGSGAFMRDEDSAEKLAEIMKSIAYKAGKKCSYVISDMNQPLGYTVGNSLEIEEAVRFLSGREQSPQLKELIMKLCVEMYKLSDLYLIDDSSDSSTMKESDAEIINKLSGVLDSGKAYDKFKEFVSAQGGDLKFIKELESSEDYNSGYDGYKEELTYEDIVRLSKRKKKSPIISEINNKALITGIDAEKVGRVSLLLGAGRRRKDDEIDHGAGVLFRKVVGESISEGDVLAVFYTKKKRIIKQAERMLASAYELFVE